MAKVAEKTLTPDKINMFKDYDSVLQRVLTESKKEVEALQGRRETLIITLAQLNDDINRKQSQFEQWKRLEEQKMQDMKSKLNNEIIRREKAIEVGELDLSRRIEECARREEIGRRVVEKDTKLNNDRIEIEKLRSSANRLMDEASNKMSEAMNAVSRANQMEQKAKEMLDKSNMMNESLLSREHALEDKEKNIKLAEKNLEELKLIVDPKIKQISELEKKNEALKKELAEREESVNRKINEEKIILKDLEIREKNIKQREMSLSQTEEEIKRKALGINV